jgi:Putative Ig domain
MRRSRRGVHGIEFGGSGEDSFVAVVVTKLTGALLFILLLTMVIMALLPKVADLPSSPGKVKGASDAVEPAKLVVTTPAELPEAIAGRPYRVAFAADGGRGHRRWTLLGDLPKGLSFDRETGLLEGTPETGTPEPAVLTIGADDESSHASRAVRLVVYKPDAPLTMPSRWKPSLPPIPWRDWLEQGFGFLVLWLVYVAGMSTLDGLKRRSAAEIEDEESARSVKRRFLAYKVTLTLLCLAATAALATWLWWPRSG